MKFLVILSTLFISSCSVFIAGSKQTSPISKQEVKKQITQDNFEESISSNVIDTINVDDNSYYKVYSLSYDSFAKVRMFIHAGLDIVTVGLWELIATPGEANSNMQIYYLKILYVNKTIKSVEILNDYTLKKEAI